MWIQHFYRCKGLLILPTVIHIPHFSKASCHMSSISPPSPHITWPAQAPVNSWIPISHTLPQKEFSFFFFKKKESQRTWEKGYYWFFFFFFTLFPKFLTIEMLSRSGGSGTVWCRDSNCKREIRWSTLEGPNPPTGCKSQVQCEKVQ